MGSKSIWMYANGIARKKIREHAYRCAPEVSRELERIYTRAKGDVKLEESFKFVK
jgi:hypothetical protein